MTMETTQKLKVRFAVGMFALLLAMALPVAVPAYAEDWGSKCGENLTWAYDAENKVLTISGMGDMYDYEFKQFWEGETSYYSGDTPWHTYSREIVKVVVEDGVTSIGNYAFCECPKLSEASLPSSLLRMGDSVFLNVGLDASVKEFKVALPDNLQTIGECAFSGSSIKSVRIPKGVKKLDRTFDSSLIEQVDLGEVEEIVEFAFYQCPNLTNIVLPNTLKRLGTAIFDYTPITEIIIPEGVESIGTLYADGYMPTFGFNEDLKRVVFPKSIKSINENELVSCDNIEEIGYRGTEEQWKKLVRGIDPESPLAEVLKKAKVVYNYDGPIAFAVFADVPDQLYNTASSLPAPDRKSVV